MVHCNTSVRSLNPRVSFQAAGVDITTVLITVMEAMAVSCRSKVSARLVSGLLLMAFILQVMEEALVVIMGVTEGITKVITRVEAEAMEEETVMTTAAIVRVVASQLFFKWWMDAAELSDLCLQITAEVGETTTTWATTNPSHPTLVR